MADERKGYRLGVYDAADESVPVEFTGRRYRDTLNERIVMRAAIRTFNQICARRPGCTLVLAAFEATTRKPTSSENSTLGVI